MVRRDPVGIRLITAGATWTAVIDGEVVCPATGGDWPRSRVIGGNLLMPAELQTIHRFVVETPVLKTVTEEIRAVVETVWPELIAKLPPKP